MSVDVPHGNPWIDLPLAAAVVIVCDPVFKSEQLVSRGEGLARGAACLASLLRLRH